MDIELHKQATKHPRFVLISRPLLPTSQTRALAERFGVSDMTIHRWRHRDDVHDRPHTRHNLMASPESTS